MPNDTYEVRKYKSGYAVYGVKSGKRHSKKPLTKSTAERQARAIYRSENLKKEKK